MTFWIDGDSCPSLVRHLLGRTAKRLGHPLWVVANRPIPMSPEIPVTLITVGPEEGAADEYILQNSLPGDLVVTRDIPLGAKLLEKSILALNDRGDVFSKDFVRERLSLRDFSLTLRLSGVSKSGGNNYGRKEYELFARTLDRELQKLLRTNKSPESKGL